MEDGSGKLIAFASRSLALAEKKYSQLDKEGLAIIFGVKRFHQYLVGRHFVILSDYKPLQHLFRETSGVPTLASARIQRWALILGAYDYCGELVWQYPVNFNPTSSKYCTEITQDAPG